MFRIESLSLLQYEEDPQSRLAQIAWAFILCHLVRLLWMVMEGCNREYTGTVSFGADSRAKAIACIFTTLVHGIWAAWVHLTQSSVRRKPPADFPCTAATVSALSALQHRKRWLQQGGIVLTFMIFQKAQLSLLSGGALCRCEVVTGYGKSRKDWETSDIRAAVMSLLQHLNIPFQLGSKNPGLLELSFSQRDLPLLQQRLQKRLLRKPARMRFGETLQ
ncbi:unnamed protein product [Effrenium voratum]|nr:unnamed protein product [Effrenium voratum]